MVQDAKELERKMVKSLLFALLEKKHGAQAAALKPAGMCKRIEDGVTSQHVGEGVVSHMLWYNEGADTRVVEVRTNLKPEQARGWIDVLDG